VNASIATNQTILDGQLIRAKKLERLAGK